VSVVTGVVMLLIFGKTSNQRKIAETKDRLKAYIMEMWIFRNDTRVMLSSIGHVVAANLSYLRHSLRPIVFLIVPVLIIMVQLGIRYQHQPLDPGEETVITVTMREGVVPTETRVELVGVPGVRPSSPALRIDSTREISWKIQPRFTGEHEVSIVVGEDDVETKTVAVGPTRAIGALSAVRPPANTWRAFLYPSEPPVPSDSPVESISVRYPRRDLSLFGLHVNWLLAFFVVSVAAGFALKGVFGIEV
jgi:hypothetical protein